MNTLRTMVSRIAQLDTQIARALDKHPDGEIFSSFFAAATQSSAPRPYSPRSATAAPATRIATRSPPMAVKPRRCRVRETPDREVSLGVQPSTTPRPRGPGASGSLAVSGAPLR